MNLNSFTGPISDAANNVSTISSNAVDAIKGLEGFDMYIYGSSSFYEDPAAVAVKDQIEGGTQALNDLRDAFEDCREQTLIDWRSYRTKVCAKMAILRSQIMSKNASIKSHQNCSKHGDDYDGEQCTINHGAEISKLEDEIKILRDELKVQKKNLETADTKITETQNMQNPVISILTSFISNNTPFQKSSDVPGGGSGQPAGGGSGQPASPGGSTLVQNESGQYVLTINGKEKTFDTKEAALAALNTSVSGERDNLVTGVRRTTGTDNSASVIELDRQKDDSGNTIITMSDGTQKTIYTDGTTIEKRLDGSVTTT